VINKKPTLIPFDEVPYRLTNRALAWREITTIYLVMGLNTKSILVFIIQIYLLKVILSFKLIVLHSKN